jgi:raffinose/stachyose/melibiose transport system permease protein
MLPLVILNSVVIVVPSMLSVWYSFTDWTGLGPANFIGLDNYSRMFSDDEFRSALAHNLVWTAISLVVPMALGLLGAYLLSRITRFQLLFRLAYFIPYTVASVVSAAVWKNLLSPDHGVGSFLGVNFLGSQSLALPSVAMVNTWAFWGFLVVVFLASMQSVNPALYEAAALDGAGPLRQFVSITIPSIRPTLVFLVVQTVIWSFLAFDFVYILTQGGPGGATDVLSTLMYRNAFSNLEAGYASAIGVVMAILSGSVVIVYQYLRKARGWEA